MQILEICESPIDDLLFFQKFALNFEDHETSLNEISLLSFFVAQNHDLFVHLIKVIQAIQNGKHILDLISLFASLQLHLFYLLPKFSLRKVRRELNLTRLIVIFQLVHMNIFINRHLQSISLLQFRFYNFLLALLRAGCLLVRFVFDFALLFLVFCSFVVDCILTL